jgi:uncharacterized protein
MGIRMLLNENHAIKRDDQQIYLAGIDDAHFYRVDNIETRRQVSDGGVLDPVVAYARGLPAGFLC